MNTIDETIFRAYDIRGRYQQEIDQTIFYKIGMSVGTYVKRNLRGDTLCVGNDIRQTSTSLSYAFISGLTTTGINVINTGTTSFGQTLFYGWDQQHDLISYITASHLPAEWNGIKFYYGDGVGLPEKELINIRDITLTHQWEKNTWNKTGTIHTENPKTAYATFLTNRFKYKKPLRVAIDCGGGSMTLSAPAIFADLGLEVVPVYCTPDPLFSVRPSDPKPEHLTTLQQAVLSHNCDFGVAFDGDGDRAVIVDDKGKVLSADQIGIIIGKYGLTQTKGTVIVNVECSKTVEEQLKPLGFSIKYIQVGHTFLTLHAKNEQAPLGIESSGHLIIPEYFLFDDALIIPLKIAEILQKQRTSLSEIQHSIPTYPIKKVEIACDDHIKFQVIKTLQKSFKTTYDNVNTLDGIRVELDDGWVLIRASNTSPLIRLTVEADRMSSVEELIKLFSHNIESTISNEY